MNMGNTFHFETPNGAIEYHNNPPDLIKLENAMSDANTFRVKIDQKMRNGLNAETTCLVIASAIVIDITFYEHSGMQNRGEMYQPHRHPHNLHHQF